MVRKVAPVKQLPLPRCQRTKEWMHPGRQFGRTKTCDIGIDRVLKGFQCHDRKEHFLGHPFGARQFDAPWDLPEPIKDHVSEDMFCLEVSPKGHLGTLPQGIVQCLVEVSKYLAPGHLPPLGCHILCETCETSLCQLAECPVESFHLRFLTCKAS